MMAVRASTCPTTTTCASKPTRWGLMRVKSGSTTESLGQRSTLATHHGTPNRCAPEVYQGKPRRKTILYGLAICKPLSDAEAAAVFASPTLRRRRILKSRAAPSEQNSEWWRSVRCSEPDLRELSRETAAPLRQPEYLVYALFITAARTDSCWEVTPGSSGVAMSRLPFCRACQNFVDYRFSCCRFKMV